MKAFLHAPHNKSFLYGFLSFVLHLTGTRKLQPCLVPALVFLLFPFCRQRECLSTSNTFSSFFSSFFPSLHCLFFSLSLLHLTFLLRRCHLEMLYDTTHAHTYRKFICLAEDKLIPPWGSGVGQNALQ